MAKQDRVLRDTSDITAVISVIEKLSAGKAEEDLRKPPETIKLI